MSCAQGTPGGTKSWAWCWKSDCRENLSAVLGVCKMTTGVSFLWTFREVFVTGVCV